MCHWLIAHKRSVQSTFDVLSDAELHFTSRQPLLICPFPDTAKSAKMTKLSLRRAPSKRKAAKVARKRIVKVFKKKMSKKKMSKTKMSKTKMSKKKMSKKKMSKKKMYTPHESILQALDMAGIGPIKGVEMVANPIIPDSKVGFSRHSGPTEMLKWFVKTVDAGHPTHPSGPEQHAFWSGSSKDVRRKYRKSTDRVPVAHNTNPNVGLLLCRYVWNNQEQVRLSTGTVIGESGETIITCAHNIVGCKYNKTLTPYQIQFFRGLEPLWDVHLDPNTGDLRAPASDFGKTFYTFRGNFTKIDINGNNKPDIIQIHPNYNLNTGLDARADVALIKLPNPCARTVSKIRFLEVNGKMPRHCRVDGYPQISLEQAGALAGLNPQVVNGFKQQAEKCKATSRFSNLYCQSQLLGGSGELPPFSKPEHFDVIYHTVYATVGQSGAPLWVTDKRGNIKDWTMFGLHFGAERNPNNEVNELSAVLLGDGIKKWIHDVMRNQFRVKPVYPDKRLGNVKLSWTEVDVYSEDVLMADLAFMQ